MRMDRPLAERLLDLLLWPAAAWAVLLLTLWLWCVERERWRDQKYLRL